MDGIDAGAVSRPPPEAAISSHLRQHLERLATLGRCVWRAEVRLLAWTHASKSRPDVLRLDFIAQFDAGPLVGIEVKRRLDRPAELGRALTQCAQYASAQVAAAQAQRVPAEWISQPLAGVFLRLDSRNLSADVAAHAAAATRLFGPAGVGFASVTKWDGLRLDICAGRWWSERDGYRADALARKFRVGNGSFRPGCEA